MSTARRSSAATPQRVTLLRQLSSSTLSTSPVSALFFAERLLAIDPHREESVLLIATALAANSRPLEAIWALRQPVNFSPVQAAAHDGGDQAHSNHVYARRWPNPKNVSRPALEASVRCARLYAQQCALVGRDKEGREALAKVLVPGTPLAPSATTDSLDPANPFRDPEPWVYDLEMARLARKASEHDRAVVGFRKVLDLNPWCWDALDALCALGQPPDPDQLFPPRPRAPQSHSAPMSPVAPTHTQTRPLAPAPHPPPLGPSQTSAVNSSVPFVVSKARGGPGGGSASGVGGPGMGEGLELLYTPGDAGGVTGAPGGVPGIGAKVNGDGKRLFALTAGGIWKAKPGLPPHRGGDDISMDDSTSFDTSFYPSQAPPPSVAFLSHAALTNAHASGSNSLFTPPPVTTLPTIAAPGVKRARGQAASSHTAEADDVKPPGRRPVRGVPSEKKDKHPPRDTSNGAPTRRSSRLSRDTNSSSTGLASGSGTAPGPSSSSMAVSRSQGSRSGVSAGSTTAAGSAARDKKRSKNGTGPSVLSDGGSEARSPTSHSSSPAPSSPGGGGNHQALQLAADPAVQEAEDYVVGTLRCFGRAAVAAARYEGAKVIEALMALPVEQQKSWRCLIGVGRAHLEMLNYDKAEKSFAQARIVAPHLLDSMELYSTLLWHLRLPTALSFLAQDLMVIAPRSPSSWIAAGNVFSHLEDHAAALKCFKRAAQLDVQCVYAYTLSGHECVVLEEWERALGFFREAVKLDPRHYNAWFGLGNVYMQTGKFRLAEFYFRKAVEINPRNATLICCVGSVLEKLGKRKEALELYERACLLAPESPAVRFKRVKILISLKQYQTAESDLLALKDRAPNEFNVHFLLGKLYKVLGRKPDMLKSFTLAQDLEPRMAALIRETILAEGGPVGPGDKAVEEEDGEEQEEMTF